MRRSPTFVPMLAVAALLAAVTPALAADGGTDAPAEVWSTAGDLQGPSAGSPLGGDKAGLADVAAGAAAALGTREAHAGTERPSRSPGHRSTDATAALQTVPAPPGVGDAGSIARPDGATSHPADPARKGTSGPSVWPPEDAGTQREQVAAELAQGRGDDPVGVIVGLAVGWAPEAVMDADKARGQRGRVEQVREQLVAGLPDRGRVTHTFEQLPLVGLELPASALAGLARSPHVATISPLELVPVALGDSVPLVEAGATHGLATCPATGDSVCAGAGTTVAIIDTGVDRAHPFFGGRVIEEACYSFNGGCPGGVTAKTGTGAGVPCVGVSSCFHGTHVAGIAAGRSASMTGVAPGANLMSVNVFSHFSGDACGPQGGSCVLAANADIIKGMERVAARASARNIAAVNMSLGGGAYSSHCDAQFPAYGPAVDALRAADVTIVVASGNSGSSSGIGSPACLSEVIAVGNTTKSDTVAPSSQSAPPLDLLAPGSNISSASPGTTTVNGQVVGNFTTATGTSMAAPHVAGAVAAIKQARPDLTPDQVLGLLEDTGTAITDGRNGITRPRIRVRSAILGQAPDGGGGGGGTAPTICPPDDVYEDNDGASGTVLLAGQPYSAIACDDDWYVIYAESGQTVTVDVQFSHAAGDIDVDFHGTGGPGSPDPVVGGSGDDNEFLEITTTATGYQWVKVYGYLGAKNAYQITLSSSGCADGFEGNDTWAAGEYFASLPVPNTLARICPDESPTAVTGSGDVVGGDWYYFTATAGQFLSTDIYFAHGAGDLDLYLISDDLWSAARADGATEIEAFGASVLSQSLSVSDNESIRLIVPGSGDYSLFVDGYAGATNQYFLNINQSASCLDDLDESDPEGLTQLYPEYDEWAAAMLCADDVDWYGAWVPAGATLVSTLTYFPDLGIGGNGHLKLYLFDEDGTVLGQGRGTDTGGGFVYQRVLEHTVPLTSTSGEPVYIAVIGDQATVSNFYYAQVSTVSEGNRPVYDQFSSAEQLQSVPSFAVADRTTHGTTAETGEPAHAGFAADTSIWFSWTAPQTGQATFTTQPAPNAGVAAGETTFDTVLAAYKGTSLGALSPVKANDDAASDVTWSQVTFPVTKGQTYQLAVDGPTPADVGVLRLGWSVQRAVAAAPSGVTALAGNRQTTVRWNQQPDDGREPVERYRVVVEPGGKVLTLNVSDLSTAGGIHETAVTGLDNGTSYTVTVQALSANSAGADGTSAGVSVTPTLPPSSRLSGTNRYATAAAISAATFAPGVPVVYVATGRNFPDALAGVPRAALDGGPILLATTSAIPTETAAELQRLQPGRIVILGGTSAVGTDVQTALATFTTGGVTRLAGTNRYATAAAIAATFPAGVPVAYVATGRGFADALAGGAAASVNGGPVLLVEPGSLPTATREQLERLSPGRIVVLGGTSAVSAAVYQQLTGLAGTGGITRLSGSDRYATAAQVAGTFTTPVSAAYVARGGDFPDALAGGVVAGLGGAPVLLVPTSGAVPATVLTATGSLAPQKVIALGGSAAVSDTTLEAVRQAAGG